MPGVIGGRAIYRVAGDGRSRPRRLAYPAYVSGGTLRGVIARNNPVLTELSRHSPPVRWTVLNQSTRSPSTTMAKNATVELPGAIIGKGLALELGLRVGDPVILISPASIGAGAGTPRLRRFVVGGFFYSGMYEFDSSLIFVANQRRSGAARRRPATRIAASNCASAISSTLRRSGSGSPRMAGKGFSVSDWTQNNAPLFAALKLEKFTYFLVLLLIVLVAAFNIVATLVMVVMERRKEIAILRAMGARAGSIASIFLCEGAALGVGGT